MGVSKGRTAAIVQDCMPSKSITALIWTTVSLASHITSHRTKVQQCKNFRTCRCSVRPRQKLGEQEREVKKEKKRKEKRARMQGSRSKKCPERGLSNTLPSWAVNRPSPSHSASSAGPGLLAPGVRGGFRAGGLSLRNKHHLLWPPFSARRLLIGRRTARHGLLVGCQQAAAPEAGPPAPNRFARRPPLQSR